MFKYVEASVIQLNYYAKVDNMFRRITLTLFCGVLVFFTVVLLSLNGCSSDSPSSTVSLEGPPDSGGGLGGTGGGSGGDDPVANDSSGSKGTWDLPRAEVATGCLGRDCIPSIESPVFVNTSDVDFVDDTDLVWGLVSEGKVWGFPENIMDWHEVVNLRYRGQQFVITYCPLTGSAVALDLMATGEQRSFNEFEGMASFGVSGLLYNNNLINYDRGTGSNWAQMYLRCVNGRYRGVEMITVPLIETTFRNWKKMFPNSLMLSDDTGFDRNYDIFPYGNFKEVEGLLFPINNHDRRLFFKERLHGIVTDRVGPSAKTYRFSFFAHPRAVNDQLDGLSVVVAGMQDADTYVSYLREVNGTTLTFEIKTDNPDIYPFDLVDNEGTVWNVLGHAISGPRTGERLIATPSYNAYWFAWGTFFEDVPIHR